MNNSSSALRSLPHYEESKDKVRKKYTVIKHYIICCLAGIKELA